MPTERILSVCTTNNADMIAQAAKLWIGPRDVVIDTTYGKGNFWTVFEPRRFITHDLNIDGVDCRHLPEKKRSAHVVVIDLPYVSKGGRATATIDSMDDAYGMAESMSSPKKVDALITAGMKEAHRVLKTGGRLMVKITDYVSSGKYHKGHTNIVNAAERIGFEQVDEFILVRASGGPQPERNLDGSARRQVHSHRAHSFLCVFRKT